MGDNDTVLSGTFQHQQSRKNAAAQLNSWVPVATAMDSARAALEKKGFTCSPGGVAAYPSMQGLVCRFSYEEPPSAPVVRLAPVSWTVLLTEGPEKTVAQMHVMRYPVDIEETP